MGALHVSTDVCDLPGHAEVAGTENGHPCMRQGSQDELVETGADVSILPHRERILLVCMTEACDQLGRPKVPHPSSYLTAVILEKYLRSRK